VHPRLGGACGRALSMIYWSGRHGLGGQAASGRGCHLPGLGGGGELLYGDTGFSTISHEGLQRRHTVIKEFYPTRSSKFLDELNTFRIVLSLDFLVISEGCMFGRFLVELESSGVK